MKTLTADGHVPAPARAAGGGRRRERLFYTGMSAAFLLVVFAGFARSYYLKAYFGAPPALSPLLHFHGLVFSAWIVLLLAQTSLVAARRTGTHRRLGVLGGALAALMVVVGTATAVIRAKVVEVPPGSPSPLVFLTIPLGDMVMFGSFVTLAFVYRRRLAAHKRLMLLATIALLPAATGRLPSVFIPELGRWAPLVFFAIADLFIIPMALFDRRVLGRVHPATVYGGLALALSHPLRLALGFTGAWLAFATWATRPFV